MTTLLAVDPSIRSPGVALFVNGQLAATACVKFPIDTAQNDGTRCLTAAKAIVQWTRAIMGTSLLDAVAFEWPQIYKHDTPSKANSVVPMAGVNMAVAAMFNVLGPTQVFAWVPAEIWGQLPKRKTGSALGSPRGERIWSRLTEAERNVIIDQHDSLDAVGIGLHACGRLGVRRAAFVSG